MDLDADVRRGLLAGVIATIAMSIPMIAATATGISPMPEPVPKAIAVALLGAGAPMGAVLAVAAIGHLAYGGFWGAVLTSWRGQITWTAGLGLGAGLWVVMGLVVLPLLGWGPFGTGITPKIAVATLVLHLIYGATLPWTDQVLGATQRASTPASTGDGV